MSENSGTTLLVNTRFVIEDCPSCGCLFAMTSDLVERRRKDHERFYCPNGHSMSFTGKTDEQKALERASQAETRARQLADQLERTNREIESQRRQHAATKGQLTKVRNRIEKGVCPHCTRHFVNVERHMASQHPHDAPKAIEA